MARNLETFTEIDIHGDYAPDSFALQFSARALSESIQSSRSLTVYIPPINLITGWKLNEATENTPRLLRTFLDVDYLTEHENSSSCLIIRRDHDLHDFEPILPQGAKASLLPMPTGYVRAEVADEQTRFTVGAINFDKREFTAVLF